MTSDQDLLRAVREAVREEVGLALAGMAPDTLYTPKEAADKLRISTKALLRLVREGHIANSSEAGQPRISQRSINAYIRRCETPHRPRPENMHPLAGIDPDILRELGIPVRQGKGAA